MLCRLLIWQLTITAAATTTTAATMTTMWMDWRFYQGGLYYGKACPLFSLSLPIIFPLFFCIHTFLAVVHLLSLAVFSVQSSIFWIIICATSSFLMLLNNSCAFCVQRSFQEQYPSIHQHFLIYISIVTICTVWNGFVHSVNDCIYYI
jgi:hypothetical protein